jgi:predicted SAM-dependent methyltransferase
MTALNIGCGARFHPEWTNLDLAPADLSIRAHDARLGLPFKENTFDFVYHSHVLEHFTLREGSKFLAECFRVLKPEGVLRVAVPDLESIAREYLNALEAAHKGEAGARANHEWMVMELFDQSSRQISGGAVREFLDAPDLTNEAFVLERWGAEAGQLIRHLRDSKNAPQSRENSTLWKRILRGLTVPAIWKEWLIEHLLGKDYECLKIGRFRQSGEIHLTMYDRFSLTSRLSAYGFAQIELREASKSAIPNWMRYQLDADENGRAHKPDSLFIEGVKPASR